MKGALIKNMTLRFAAYDELVLGCSDATLQTKLEVPKHKFFAEHLWCIVGARKSYAAAIEADEWKGFSCSLQQFSQADFSSKLKESAAIVLSTLSAVEDWLEPRIELARNQRLLDVQ